MDNIISKRDSFPVSQKSLCFFSIFHDIRTFINDRNIARLAKATLHTCRSYYTPYNLQLALVSKVEVS